MRTMQVEIKFPNWVKFMATDNDGWVYGYSHEPKKYYSMSLWRTEKGKEIFLYHIAPPKDWTQELYEVLK